VESRFACCRVESNWGDICSKVSPAEDVLSGVVVWGADFMISSEHSIHPSEKRYSRGRREI